MVYFFKRLIVIFVLFVSAAFGQMKYVPGQLIVQLNNGADPETFFAQSRTNPLLSSLKVEEYLSKSFNIYLLNFDQGLDHEKVLSNVNKLNCVKAVQFNHLVENRSTVPDDPSFPLMWDMENTGQNGGVADADIDATEAWDITTGGITAKGDTIVVAVVDDGFQLTHEDLNFWKNYAEIPLNGIDDDLNGYIDDFNGWNAFSNNDVVGTAKHGTHVSGTVGAKGNNGKGVTGVSWNVKVMAVKGSSGNEATVVKAYTYIFDQRKLYAKSDGAKGAFVVATNSSFGVDFGQPSNYPIWCSMYDSLGSVGILSATATANKNTDVDAFGDIPTACESEYMISVTNTNRLDKKNSGAAYGLTTIDLGAPGTDITSTTPTNLYESLTGTSMATPHVAGAIGLLYSALCTEMFDVFGSKPDTMAQIVRNILLTNTDSITDLAGKTVTGGRLNIYKPVVEAYTMDCQNLGVLANAPLRKNTNHFIGVYPNPSSGKFEVEYELKSAGPVTFNIYGVTGSLITSISRSNTLAGHNQHLLNFSDLPRGLYFLCIEGQGIKSNAMKIVIAE